MARRSSTFKNADDRASREARTTITVDEDMARRLEALADRVGKRSLGARLNAMFSAAIATALEAAEAIEPAPRKRRLNLIIPRELHARAEAANVNVSLICRRALAEKIEEIERDADSGD